MRSLRADNRRAVWISSLLVTLLLTACAGVEPFEPRDYREEGPERGLLSGADGEFVFYINLDEKGSASVESKEEFDNQRE